MIDREKVIKGLELCNEKNLGFQCPLCYCYPLQNSDKCIFKLHADALALLKAQEPRLLTLDEIHDSMVVYLEAGTEFLKRMDDDGVVLAIGGSECTGAKCFITVWNVGIAGMNNDYNVTWRAWSQRPTIEQRKREPWNRRVKDDQR